MLLLKNKNWPFVLIACLLSGISYFLSYQPVLAQVCLGGSPSGTQGTSCTYHGEGAGYCAFGSNADLPCTCDGSCSCTVRSLTCGTNYSNFGFCTQSDQSCDTNAGCPTNIYSGNLCNHPLTFVSCVENWGDTRLYCGFTAAPSPTNGGGGGPAPTTPPPAPTATPIPTATPTPAIIGNIYNDPNDGTVAIGGGGMCVKSGAAPVGTSVANALIEAVKTSNGAVSAGLVTGSSYKITAGLVSGASDYTLALVLPTPAAGVLTSYVCSCPASANEYLCNYSNINANGTANFFVRQRCTRLKSSDAAAVIG